MERAFRRSPARIVKTSTRYGKLSPSRAKAKEREKYHLDVRRTF